VLQYSQNVPDRETRAISGNLLEAMRFFGNARSDGAVQDLPGVCLITCGLNYAAFNAAVLSEPISVDAGQLRRNIELAAGHYRSRDLRWTYWLCEDFLEGPIRRESRAMFQRLGLNPLTDPPGLFADCLLPPRRMLPAIRVRRVDNEATRTAFAHLTSVAFEIPSGICREIYGGPRAWSGSFEGYVGYVGEAPVSTTATVVTDDVVGIYSVGTSPQCRRHGYAEATMREVLRQVRERTGIEATVLQSTASGFSLYEQMGYRKCTRFSVYIS
jgi:ribosomal protein S18 acetylase RimI-like enzyme